VIAGGRAKVDAGGRLRGRFMNVWIADAEQATGLLAR
jgi:DNA-binding transcriptional regulator LsrR (DeoR family)